MRTGRYCLCFCKHMPPRSRIDHDHDNRCKTLYIPSQRCTQTLNTQKLLSHISSAKHQDPSSTNRGCWRLIPRSEANHQEHEHKSDTTHGMNIHIHKACTPPCADMLSLDMKKQSHVLQETKKLIQIQSTGRLQQPAHSHPTWCE